MRISGGAGACCASIRGRATPCATSSAATAPRNLPAKYHFCASPPGDTVAAAERLSSTRPRRTFGMLLEHGAPVANRLSMGSTNKLKLGDLRLQPQFGEKRDARSRALERLVGRQRAARADGRRLRLGILSAARPLARLGRRDALPRIEFRNAHVGGRAARVDQTHHDFRNGAYADLPPGRRGEADGDRRSRRPRALRAQPRRRQQRRRVRDVRRLAARARRALRARTGMARHRPPPVDGSRKLRLQRQVLPTRPTCSPSRSRTAGRNRCSSMPASPRSVRISACATATRFSPPCAHRTFDEKSGIVTPDVAGVAQIVDSLRGRAARRRAHDGRVHERQRHLPPDAKRSDRVLPLRSRRERRLGSRRRATPAAGHRARPEFARPTSRTGSARSGSSRSSAIRTTSPGSFKR